MDSEVTGPFVLLPSVATMNNDLFWFLLFLVCLPDLLRTYNCTWCIKSSRVQAWILRALVRGPEAQYMHPSVLTLATEPEQMVSATCMKFSVCEHQSAVRN